MNHRYPAICFSLVFIFTLFTHTVAASPAIPQDKLVGVCSAIVYDLDNDAILFEQNADQRIPPASLTKIMSMFLALDFIKSGHAKFDTLVPVSRDAVNAGGSRMGLKMREYVPLNRLLMGMAVSSGNDASHAVAEYVGGSAPAFVRMMNARAAALGMDNTNFANPHGMPAAGQYTTARDMLALARAYLRAHPESLNFHNTRTLTHGGYTSWNKNPLLGQYPGADGLKSGWIRASGYNLVFTASRGAKRLLAVILGAPDTFTRGTEACRLLDAGFMVCGNEAVSVAAALDSIPFDLARIDPQKTARENGLLKARSTGKRVLAAKKRGSGHALMRASNLPQPKTLRKKGGEMARQKVQTARKTHAARRSSARRG